MLVVKKEVSFSFAEKINMEFLNAENFEQHWVRVDYGEYHCEKGLLLPMCKGSNYYGKMTDFVVVWSINENVWVRVHEMIDIELIKSIKMGQNLEQNFKESTPERQKEIFEWLDKSGCKN